MLRVIEQASQYGDATAIKAGAGKYSYKHLLDRSADIAAGLVGDRGDLQGAPIAFMVEPGFDYVASLWGIWRAGGIAVPVCLSHPPPAIEHVLRDTEAQTIVLSPNFMTVMEPLAKKQKATLRITNEWAKVELKLPDISRDRRAMILYTSGTTNLPKGVVTTHRNIEAQISVLVHAWEWTGADHTLCVLPLHHVHGIVNVVSCALWSGGCCEFLPEFDAGKVFEVFLRGQVNVFMAVPTIYFKLIGAWEKLPHAEQQKLSQAMRKMRLMVSGSAALPVSVMERWETISGHRLLERYGMTELGMAISNPYDGERRAGMVGKPLSGVEVRLCNEKNEVTHGEPGEIQIRGENVFTEYWRQPDTTRKAFTPDGWFKTGDVAVVEEGYYRILGRNSVDIIKSGGYKVSALEIEEVLRTHADIDDCAVVGLEDIEWGEVVAAALVVNRPLDTNLLTGWLKERIPAYRVPRRFIIVNDLPRNAMGKIVKKEVKELFSV